MTVRICWPKPPGGHQRFPEALINQLLTLAVLVSALFALVSPFLVFTYVIAPLVERLVSPAAYRWVREIDSNHLELAVPLVHAPLLSGGAAVLASIGTNAITDARDSTLRFWFGIGFIAAGLIALAGGGAWLLRIFRTSRPWLTRVRLQLRQCAELQQAPDDLLRVRARVDRLHRVGQRMIDNTDALTLRRWVRLNRGDARSFAGMSLGNLAALVVIVAGHPQIAAAPDTPPDTLRILWYTAIPPALGVIALPLGPVIQRNLRRWWLHRVGAELVHETTRAEAALRRVAPPPAPVTIRSRIRRWWRT